ncbi:hypothetical protein LTR84_000041 [Exophiala bonariae]|uniref:Transcription factor domain-containing protein n=1 Tax=Exophiala bonariae TaxID=1690606 RepID=A0AAV9NT77_9EURO|nr:hypothetical protein LTR84_000041 [Exophiala bonariae]
MQDFEHIGAYDYVAAMNAVLHHYETPEKSDCGSAQTKASIKPDQTRRPFQSVFEHEMGLKTSSPVLSQVFSNSMMSQTSIDPDNLSSKFQVLTFADEASATDSDKLLSTIASEPYIMEVLEVSTHWWISWRDQAFALHEVFLNAEYLPAHVNTALAMDSNVAGGAKSKPIPISLQDFVRSKLAQKDNAIAIATGLLGIAMSLQVLRSGIDDTPLHLSCPPGELMDRIVLAVDSVVLSSSANSSYMNDPSILLLLMARSKMYAEGNQVHKSFLILRTAIHAAKAMGFVDPNTKLRPSQIFPGVPNAEEGAKTSAVSTETGEDVTQLVVRQRFLGSILELDRLMSMVLGFPYYMDENFTDQLAFAVLRDEAGLQVDSSQPNTSNIDIKMRALRRIVAIIAGKTNDRNVRASSGIDDSVLHAETMNLQASLIEAGATMPPGWWNMETHVEAIPSDPFFVHEHLMTQLWYWQTQAFLHLLFMLKPMPSHEHLVTSTATNNTSPSPDMGTIDIYQENRILCFQGCRGVLRIFNLLRANPTMAVYVCNCDDFQGVLTGCILLVGLLMCKAMCPGEVLRDRNNLVAWPGQDEITESLALVEETKDLFRYRSQRQGGFISKQGLKVLVELGSFFDDDVADDADDGAGHDSLGFADTHIGVEKGIPQGKPRRRVVIMPYFGTINLEFGPSAIQPIRPYLDPVVGIEQYTVDNMLPAFDGPNSIANPPLNPPVSSNGHSIRDGDMASAVRVEQLKPDHEAFAGPDCTEYSYPDIWPHSSTEDWTDVNTGEGEMDANFYNGVDGNNNGPGLAYAPFRIDGPDVNPGWDQFLFGDELGKDWNVELPEWYALDDVTWNE